MTLGLHFRDDERRHFIMGRQWYLAPTIRGRYLGTLMKGWWKLGKSSITDHFEIGIAIGGEDNMLQGEVVLPFLGRAAIGLRLPRKLTNGWLYDRREWALRIGYVGRWIELLIASEENMRDTGMVDYYRRKRKQPADCGNCGHYHAFHTDPVLVPPSRVKSLDDVEKRVPNPTGRCITYSEVNHDSAPCECPGYVAKKPTWNRLQLWPGVHLTFAPRLRDRLLGRQECVTTKGEPQPVIVPMPEGNYPGKVTREVRTWQRKRWPFSRKTRVGFWIDMDIAVPTPGKGENSWDIDDDGIYGTGGSSVSEAIANVTRSALRQRQNYAGEGWVPSAGWPEGIGSRV